MATSESGKDTASAGRGAADPVLVRFRLEPVLLARLDAVRGAMTRSEAASAITSAVLRGNARIVDDPEAPDTAPPPPPPPPEKEALPGAVSTPLREGPGASEDAPPLPWEEEAAYGAPIDAHYTDDPEGTLPPRPDIEDNPPADAIPVPTAKTTAAAKQRGSKSSSGHSSATPDGRAVVWVMVLLMLLLAFSIGYNIHQLHQAEDKEAQYHHQSAVYQDVLKQHQEVMAENSSLKLKLKANEQAVIGLEETLKLIEDERADAAVKKSRQLRTNPRTAEPEVRQPLTPLTPPPPPPAKPRFRALDD